MNDSWARVKDAAYPPLPDGLPGNARRTPSDRPLLEDGCYFMAFGTGDPAASSADSLGTLRVESRSAPPSASGDFYHLDPGPDDPLVGEIPPRGTGIPTFPIAAYRYYIRVTKVDPSEGGFDLTFEAHVFLPKVHPGFDGGKTTQWKFDAIYTARMKQAKAPAGYPKPEMFFAGEVVRTDGTAFGAMQIGWVSSILRKGVIEIDRVAGCEIPEGNGAGVTWKSIFDPLGWDVTIVVSDGDIRKQDDLPWKRSEAAAVLAAHRDNNDLDAEWRYHILVVPLMTRDNTDFGIMYSDTREGLMMSSHFVFPADDAKWGGLRGQRNGQTVAFFRNAVHEMGHAMGLGHNQEGFGFMRTTGNIASANFSTPFPERIVWSFHPADEQRLRHWPDIAVRPGGIDTGGGIDARA